MIAAHSKVQKLRGSTVPVSNNLATFVGAAPAGGGGRGTMDVSRTVRRGRSTASEVPG
jgi:hypothetical protein